MELSYGAAGGAARTSSQNANQEAIYRASTAAGRNTTNGETTGRERGLEDALDILEGVIVMAESAVLLGTSPRISESVRAVAQAVVSNRDKECVGLNEEHEHTSELYYQPRSAPNWDLQGAETFSEVLQEAIQDDAVELELGIENDSLQSSSATIDYASVMGFALRALARREYATVELRRKLLSRGAADQVVEQVLQALLDEGSLSDRRFAAEYVRLRIRKGYGPIRIRMDLIERGISDQLAEEQLTQPAEFWQQQAAAVCAKKFSATTPTGDETEESQQRRWNRCARFLSQRGFPADLIYQVLEGRLEA